MSWLLLTKYQYVGPPNYSLLIFYGTESFFSWQSFPFFLFPPTLICDSSVGCKEKLDAGHSWFLFTFFLWKVV